MKSKILEYLKIPDSVSDGFPEDIKEFVAIIDGSQEIYAETEDSRQKEKLAELIVVWMRQLMEFLKTQKLGVYAESIVKVEEQSIPKPEPKAPEPKSPEPPKPQPPKPKPPRPEHKAPKPPKPQPPRPEPPKPPEPPKKEEIPFKVGDKFLVVSEKRDVPYTIEDIALGMVTISGFNREGEQKTIDIGLTECVRRWNSGEWIPYVEKKPKKREPKAPEPPKTKEIPFKVGDKFFKLGKKEEIYTIDEIDTSLGLVLTSFTVATLEDKEKLGVQGIDLPEAIDKWNSGEWIPYSKDEENKPEPPKPQPKAPESPKTQTKKPEPPKQKTEPPKKEKKPKYSKKELKEAIEFLEEFDDKESKKELSKLKAMYKEYYS